MAFKENYPSKLLEDAVAAISSLPGVGRRSALRLALHLLKHPIENVRHFTASIDRLRNDVKYCRDCRMISDAEVCSISSDRSRDHDTICVGESVRDVMSIENTGQYRGVYHVLGGIISPINGVGPSDLTIRELVSRIADRQNCNDSNGIPGDASSPIEVILALSGDGEGETSSFYFFSQLSQYIVKVSTLARGLGFGDDLEYADELTLGRSIVNRQPFKA